VRVHSIGWGGDLPQIGGGCRDTFSLGHESNLWFELGPGGKLALPLGLFIVYRQFMADATIKSTGKSRGRGRPPKDTVAQHFTMERDLADSIDAWIAGQPDQPSRPEAIRRLIKRGLAG